MSEEFKVGERFVFCFTENNIEHIRVGQVSKVKRCAKDNRVLSYMVSCPSLRELPLTVKPGNVIKRWEERRLMEKFKMVVEDFIPVDEQVARIGDDEWSVARLIKLTEDFEIFEIPMKFLDVGYMLPEMDLRGVVTHMRGVEAADLTFPIILDENGTLMDGRHRIMKALLEGAETIKAVRFSKNPSPCRRKG